jgi:NodT family efflux transporter outer membrane factor (OMF) lipoprotein
MLAAGTPPIRLVHRSAGLLLAAAVLASCSAVGPDYRRPPIDMPAAYTETGPGKPAEPRTVPTDRAWWHAYGDPALDALIVEADRANQNIRQAEAQYRQARAVAAAARAGFWPTAGASAGATRSRSIANRAVEVGPGYSAGVNASWEPDLWGSVRRAVEAGEAGSQASAADLAAARLSIETTLAQDYLQLRTLDLQRALYAETTAAYARALQLTRSQYGAGVALRSDVALAETQLQTAQAQAVDLDAQRSQLEHAMAILLGRAPAAFSLPPTTVTLAQLRERLPVIPTGLPSQLLERRPDIAAAERRAAAANAEIGVARAAFFPSLTLSAAAGFDSASLVQWFDAPSRVWSLGAALAQTVFDGGVRRARSEQALAAYDVAAAQYKETVLAGFQEVEDNLALLRILAHESGLQDGAVTAARLAERLALEQYRGGTATYLGVVTAQTLALANRRTAAQLLGRELVASVALITATGGGWSAAELEPAALAAAAAPASASLR